MSADDGDAGPEIVRRKFTLSREHDELLQDLAETNYQGNCSQCIRAAIKDHERSLDGSDEFEFRQLRSAVEQLESRVDDLTEEIQSRLHQQSAPQHAPSENTANNSEDNTSVQRRVQRCLLQSGEDALSLEELVGRVEAEPTSIQTAVKVLLEEDFIEKQPNSDSDLYRIQPP